MLVVVAVAPFYYSRVRSANSYFLQADDDPGQAFSPYIYGACFSTLTAGHSQPLGCFLCDGCCFGTRGLINFGTGTHWMLTCTYTQTYVSVGPG